MRSIQLKILSIVSDFCEVNNLSYSLAYGSLLGAVRHNGFIPWDDDLDISIRRDNYEFMLNNINKYNSDLVVHSIYNESDYYLPFAKISYLPTTGREDLDISYDNLGVHIDVFPIDGISNNIYKQKITNFILNILKKLLLLKLIKYRSDWNNFKLIEISILKKIIYFLNYRYINILIDKIAKKNLYSDMKFAGCLVGVYGEKEYFKKNVYESKVNINFEGYSFKCITNYNEYLNQLYGDYMKYPPIKSRVSHHNFEYYWK